MSWLTQTWGYLTELLRLFRFTDLLDIVLVALIIYQTILLVKGTRTAQIIIGLTILSIVYWLANRFEMRSLRVMLGFVFNNLFIILILIFQQEIRRALSRMGQTPLFSPLLSSRDGQVIEELIKAVVSLSNRKIGALIVIENRADVLDFVEAGNLLDAQMDRELLTSIFMPVSPLHDGAVIVRKGRIHMAGCFLPLTLNPSVSKAVGTRHRAGVGLTEETDAICVIVSEENGQISLASRGKISHGLDQAQLRKGILDALKGVS